MVLESFLDAPRGSAAEHDTLRVLIDGVTPVIEGVIRGRVGAASERQELFSEAILRLIRRLQEIKSRASANPIANWSGYAAVTAFHVVHSHLRRANPELRRLRSRIRHLVRHSDAYALWRSQSGALVCGRAHWEGVAFDDARDHELDRIPAPSSAAQLGLALEHVFEHVRRPVDLERLVETIAKWSGLSRGSQPASRIEHIDDAVSIESSLVSRSLLAEVWREVRLLPARQRIALLLGLRDDNDSPITNLLTALRIVTFEELAAAVGMDSDELAVLWDRLPLPDAVIAERLEVSRQQVINLRKSARERLGRRLPSLKSEKRRS